LLGNPLPASFDDVFSPLLERDTDLFLAYGAKPCKRG